MSKKRIPIFKGTSGLNTKVDPVRLKYGEGGIVPLAEAKNIDVDPTGRISRRKGFTTIGYLSNCHSFFKHNGAVYFISNGFMYVYRGSGVPMPVTGAIPEFGDNRCSYQSVGHRLYVCNGDKKAYIVLSTSFIWDVPAEYVGWTTQKTFSAPPLGSHLCLYKGKMLIGQDDIVWYSRPFSYHEYDLVRGFIQPGGKVRMINRVDSGVYIGTDKALKYYHGDDIAEAEVVTISEFGVVEGTDVMTSGRFVKPLDTKLNVILVVTGEGVMMLGPGGRADHLTYDRLVLPKANIGSAAVINGKYVFSLEP